MLLRLLPAHRVDPRDCGSPSPERALDEGVEEVVGLVAADLVPRLQPADAADCCSEACLRTDGREAEFE